MCGVKSNLVSGKALTLVPPVKPVVKPPVKLPGVPVKRFLN